MSQKGYTRRALLLAGAAGFGLGLATRLDRRLRAMLGNEFLGNATTDAAPTVQAEGNYSIKAFAPRFIVPAGEPVTISYGALPNAPAQSTSGYEIVDSLTNRIVRSAQTSRPLGAPAQMSYREGFTWSENLVLDGDLPPGIYRGHLNDSEGRRSDTFHFVVRRSGNVTDRPLVGIVYPTYTWQAYNTFGGGSFYDRSLADPKTVSLVRPWWDNDPPGSAPDNFTMHSPVSANYFARFLHERNIDFVPLSSDDLHAWPAWLNQLRVLVFLVHDEYWSLPMRQNVHRFLAAGGRAAVFAGNICWMKVLVQPNSISCRRWSFEPPGVQDPSGLWYRSPIHWPEEATFGQSFRFGGFPLSSMFDAETAERALMIDRESFRRSGGIKVALPTHPIFAGTGLQRDENYGSEFPILMQELDGLPLTAAGEVDRERSRAIAKDVLVLATGVGFYRDYWGENAHINRCAVVTDTKIGAGRVVHLGSFGWFRALRAGDRRAQAIVANTIRYLANSPLAQ